MADFDALHAELRDWVGVPRFPLFTSLDRLLGTVAEAIWAIYPSSL